MNEFKNEFIGLFNKYIKREGSQKLLLWLEGSDFFAAPASTRYHMACEGGLCSHSINVFKRLAAVYCAETGLPDFETAAAEEKEKVAVCGLLHDLCKVDFYDVELRNKKDENGVWQKVPAYIINDKLPYGHGEKSVYIISGFMRLTREESIAIRWHMGGFDDAVRGGSYSLSHAYEQFPFAVLLHIADLQATYLSEGKSR
ncbi:HD domain-containing protein [Ruminiclostridium sufflavum DSM 19573]|uniref:HD domain-containing protein n=1 Tax=Ruminiclostridium sufflavum DSM 19573 TaxID=1121337 RepID=A0A318XJZ9_9FIRM|nr:HD domain-containing protein [Ruminiclostridium sufflavum]PYG87650.1 HD domain-containing protein [Ruminiclostridium sufflavum DSM 19573]